MSRIYGDPLRQEGLDRTIARVAARQHGAFTREQALAAGGTKDSIHGRVRRGIWERVGPSVYRIAGTASSWHQTLLVACMSWGEDAAASHRGSAPLWRLATFNPGTVELTVGRSRNRSGPGIVHRSPLPAVDVTVVDAVPATTPARTLIDIAGVVPADRVEEALDDALRRGLVTLSRLRWRLDQLARPGRPGVTVFRKLLDARTELGGMPESVFERRLLRVLRSAGLPQPIGQYEVRHLGTVVAVVDFAYPDARLAIEADGYRWHSGRARWDRDRGRRNSLTILGWRVINVTWTDLSRRPEGIVEAISIALAEQT